MLHFGKEKIRPTDLKIVELKNSSLYALRNSAAWKKLVIRQNRLFSAVVLTEAKPMALMDWMKAAIG